MASRTAPAVSKKCDIYIGKLISVKPIVREGKLISRSKGVWNNSLFNETKEVTAGYYHILADDMNDTVTIAKVNSNLVHPKK